MKKVMAMGGSQDVVKIDKLPGLQPHLVTLPSRFFF